MFELCMLTILLLCFLAASICEHYIGGGPHSV